MYPKPRNLQIYYEVFWLKFINQLYLDFIDTDEWSTLDGFLNTKSKCIFIIEFQGF